MKLALFDNWKVGCVEDQTIVDITSSVPGWTDSWPYAWLLPLIAMAHQNPELVLSAKARSPRRALSEVRLRAPVPLPGKVIAAPVNYKLHQSEMGGKSGVYAGATIKTIEDYGLFLKPSSSVVGTGENITLPFKGRRTDHEAEIGVVIGKKSRNLVEADAEDAIVGFTALLDLSVRGGEDRPFRKGFDGFCPIGPWLVTKDEIADMDAITFRLDVNGERRQTGNTRDMIFSIRRLVSLASYQTTLYPGDIIASGTPQGVGEVRPGDRLRLEVDEIGVLEIGVNDEYAEPPPQMGEWFDQFLVSRGAPV